MKVSREQAQENHARVIATAAQLLCEKGYDGVGVAAVMKAAGLTHGGFYNNFASKDDLIAKATYAAFEKSQAELSRANADHADDAFEALIAHYLSPDHVQQASNGCILPSLAMDAARRDDPELRAIFAQAVDSYQEHLSRIRPDDLPDRPPEAMLAQLVGAVVLARALGPGDQAKALLEAVAADLTKGDAQP